MGKIWLENHFPYNECIHTWFYEVHPEDMPKRDSSLPKSYED
jgi:hypothetical protein